MLSQANISRRLFLVGLGGLTASAAGFGIFSWRTSIGGRPTAPRRERAPLEYQPRTPLDISGSSATMLHIEPWGAGATLEEIGACWNRPGYRQIELLDRFLADEKLPVDKRIPLLLGKALLYNYEAEPGRAYQILEQMRSQVRDGGALEEKWLYQIGFCQGVTAMRRGENENCLKCRGVCSCILPIAPAAVHANPDGSRLAIRHFTDYLDRFPDDLEVRWLLNVAHMTLGEYPNKVDTKFLVSTPAYDRREFDIGTFRDVAAVAGVDRFNMAGGAIMDDFDNDGLLDLFVTSWDPAMPAAYYHNQGDGTFEDRSERAGLGKQLGGLNCVQTDYDNDGNLDIFIPRGAWLPYPVRPSLLRNNGDGSFTDVTQKAGLLDAVNSNCGVWADYDNDGFLDLFVCCERQPNRLYRNRGDGTFEEVAHRAGVQGDGRFTKGAAWIDYDNDGWPDLFVNNMSGPAQLFRNNHDGTFTEVTAEMGIRGPNVGFSCWAWDYDNDGWLDIFATSYERSLADVVKGLQGRPHDLKDGNRLYRNLEGEGFQDVSKEVGLDMVFEAMGSNFADFDNDGYLDFYLGTGEPNLATLIPNRMFKNVGGKHFAEVTSSSGTGHLQKGHGVACGDLRRCGSVDLFVETGGFVNGDKYHNLLFQNPGQGNNWLTVKLVGRKTNRPAIGARIKAVTAGDKPLTVHRHVSSGSSFGGNPLQQTLGLARASRVAELEIRWPTSGTTQTFRDIDANQAIEVTEFAKEYRKLGWKPIVPA